MDYQIDQNQINLAFQLSLRIILIDYDSKNNKLPDEKIRNAIQNRNNVSEIPQNKRK